MSTKHDDVQKESTLQRFWSLYIRYLSASELIFLFNQFLKVHNGLGPLSLSDLLLTSKTLRSSGTGLLIILEPTVKHPLLNIVHVCGTACLRIRGETREHADFFFLFVFSLAFSWILFIVFLLNRLSLSTTPWADVVLFSGNSKSIPLSVAVAGGVNIRSPVIGCQDVSVCSCPWSVKVCRAARDFILH